MAHCEFIQVGRAEIDRCLDSVAKSQLTTGYLNFNIPCRYKKGTSLYSPPQTN